MSTCAAHLDHLHSWRIFWLVRRPPRCPAISDIVPADDDIDFERAASAFPDISLDGSGDIPTLATQNSTTSFKSNGSGFSFDDFDAPAPTNVKVTGDDELEKFTSSFPEIETPAPAVRVSYSFWKQC